MIYTPPHIIFLPPEKKDKAIPIYRRRFYPIDKLIERVWTKTLNATSETNSITYEEPSSDADLNVIYMLFARHVLYYYIRFG